MCTVQETTCSLKNIYNNNRVTAVETALQLTLIKIEELVMDYEQQRDKHKDYKSKYLEQKEKCESQTCRSSLELKKAIQVKDNIIQSIASSVTKLYDTRDFTTINEIFSIIYGENCPKSDQCVETKQEHLSPLDTKEITNDDMKENKMVHDESVSEIEGTPTGRTSPIIFSRKSSVNLFSKGSKKKCPETWPSPETKTIKLSYPTPTRKNGKLRQARLNVVKVKPKCLIDLTCSPEVKREKTSIDPVLVNVKQEELDDETILPSPSGLSTFYTLQKSLKGSPSKFKKPNLSLKLKVEKPADENMPDNRSEPCRRSPAKCKAENSCEADESMSLLPQLPRLGRGVEGIKIATSPRKGPLAENNNVVNVQNQCNAEYSESILRNNAVADSGKSPRKGPLVENNNVVNVQKQCNAENSESILRNNAVADSGKRKHLEPVYKEPTARKKSEKRALPGWSCDECRNFYDELYADNPQMLAQKMAECSKHRGRCDPARPRTPPGFWDPRWNVPEDTEEFNRRNDAV